MFWKGFSVLFKFIYFFFQAQYRRILSCRCTADSPPVDFGRTNANRGGVGVKGRGCGPSGGGLLQSSNPLTNPSRHRSGAHQLKENGISLKGKQFLHALFISFSELHYYQIISWCKFRCSINQLLYNFKFE